MNAPQNEQPEEVTETVIWVYAGLRFLNGKRKHSFLLPPYDITNDSLIKLYVPKGDPSPGYEYKVTVSYEDGKTWVHGQPLFHGQHANREVRLWAEARDRIGKTAHRMKVAENKAKQDTALGDALTELRNTYLALAYPDRTAFAAYVLEWVTKGTVVKKAED